MTPISIYFEFSKPSNYVIPYAVIFLLLIISPFVMTIGFDMPIYSKYKSDFFGAIGLILIMLYVAYLFEGKRDNSELLRGMEEKIINKLYNGHFSIKYAENFFFTWSEKVWIDNVEITQLLPLTNGKKKQSINDLEHVKSLLDSGKTITIKQLHTKRLEGIILSQEVASFPIHHQSLKG